MAGRLPVIYSRRTPPPSPPPLIVEPQDHDNDGNANTTLSPVAHVSSSGLSPTATSSYLSPTAAAQHVLQRSTFGSGRSASSTSMASDGVAAPDATNAPGAAADSNGPAPGAAGGNPFNFQTQYITTSPVKSNIGQRRGHRYKHSSVSAQHHIFQEPPPRPPPVLPASLPVPTIREAWSSMHRDQRARLYWCLCHALVALYVFLSASGSLAMTALSHLVFFDVGSAAICVAVDVLGNFEVWRRSSVRHPFGLQRAEVLAGFALSIFLVFGGFDLISHSLKDVLETVGHHEPHHALPGADGLLPLPNEVNAHMHHRPPAHAGHSHGSGRHVSAGQIDFASLAAAASTLVSAYGLQNHARVRKVMRVGGYLSSLLPGILSNPFHFLTLFFSFFMLLLPLLSVTIFAWLDRAVCAAIAVSMFVLGGRLAVAQGLMLLMSYNGKGGKGMQAGESGEVGAVVREIEAEAVVARVEEAKFWQVHYGLCMASLKVRVVKGCDDGALSQLRTRVTRLVQNRLGEGYGRGASLRWEVTMQTSVDGS